ncbi:MAG: universal stress protein [Hydrococcus sp. Prado102]|jgi:nucleotide-binding universal stress UspA family protein|nr:universal stress protein [Hydrococcus sp. Prado102]
MFQRILVALDSSELGKYVFEEALSLAKVTRANLMLLHVLSDAEIGNWELKNLNEHIDRWELYRQQGLELLKSRAACASQAGVNAEVTQIPGAAPAEICALAKSWGADLIVVGHRGLSGLQDLFVGSVSNYVMHYAPCSVWTVQERVAAAVTSKNHFVSNTSTLS